ncbi:MAG: SRPBCC family protein [Deltaproteobacteria bacterium]|nr:SRPBCC family protein [Deltaproteobacteria bacterium]
MPDKRSELSTWDDGVLKRELVLSRVIDAPRKLVFSAWVDANHLPQWFFPEGFTSQTHEIDLRVGGRWRFTYVGPDGTQYGNRVTFLRIEEPELIEFEHGSDKDDDPGRFRVLVSFEEQSDGKTVLTFRQLHPTKAQRDAGLGFGAVEIGYGTLGKLDRFLTKLEHSDSR